MDVVENKTHRKQKANQLLGLSLFTTGCAFWSFNALVFKLALTKFEVSVAEFGFLISCWAAPMFYVSAKLNNQDVLQVPGNNQVDLFWRCLNGVASDVFLFVSYEYISYSKGLCLFMSNTLISPFLAVYILNERVKRWDIIGILLGFLGMIFLVQPWKSADQDSDASKNLIGGFFGLCASVTAAYAFVF